MAGALPVYQAASTDSAAPFALLGAGALLVGGLAAERRSVGLSLVAGLLGGFAYLTRSDGMLIPVLIGVFFVGTLRLTRRGLWMLVALAAGCAVPMGAWWIRNLHVFGVLQPVSPMTAAALQDYVQMFNWNDPPTLRALLERGPGFITGLRWQALVHNLGVWAVISFPFGAFGWLGLSGANRPVMQIGIAYGVLLALVSAIVFSVPSLAGLFYHSAGATLPWLALGAALVIARVARRKRTLGFGLAAATAALIIIQSVFAWPRAIDDSRRNSATFGEAASWLAAHASPDEPVLATQAHSVNLASGQPAMTLPAGQELEVVRALAQRYGARYAVVTERVGRYPAEFDAHLRCRGRARVLRIGSLRLRAHGESMSELASFPLCFELLTPLRFGWKSMRSSMINGHARVGIAPSSDVRGDDRQVLCGPKRSAVPAGASVPQWGRRPVREPPRVPVGGALRCSPASWRQMPWWCCWAPWPGPS